MEEVVKLVAEYGILIVISGIFIWNTIKSSKDITMMLSTIERTMNEMQRTSEITKDALENLKHTCENQTTALSIIQNTLSQNTSALERHDKRAEYMNGDIRAMRAIMETQTKNSN